MPYNGYVGATFDSSYYTFTTTATTQTITLTNLTADVDVKVYTDAAFTTQSSNWTCSVNGGTTADSCTASIAAPAGTTLYIKAANYATTTGATYTLGITTTSTTGSEGAAGAPLTITMPHNGLVDSVNDSYYTFTTSATTQTITLTNLTDDVDLQVYTDSSFTTPSSNWSCPINYGTIAETCTAVSPASAGTVLYIRAWNYTSAGATYTLGVTTTSTTGSEGAAGAPLTISMPHNGQVAVISSLTNSYYSYTTVGTVGTINLTNLTDDVDLDVYTDSTFSTLDFNWSCTINLGTTADNCIATSPVPAGTVLYIQAVSYAFNPAGATFTLSVAP